MGVHALFATSRVRWGDVATWVGAGVNVLAVVTALYLAVRPERRQRELRPALDLELGTAEPFEVVLFNGSDVIGYRLRAAIRNIGGSGATRVQVKIERWWSETGNPLGPWVENAIDPIAANWVGQEAHDGREELTVDIPRNGREFCELLWLVSTTPNHVLRLGLRPQRVLAFDPIGGPLGEQRLALNVTCQNADGFRAVITARVVDGPAIDATNTVLQPPITEVGLSVEPDPADVERRGLGGRWSPPPSGTR